MKTEKEMREADVPWLKTSKELNEYIESLLAIEHDYGTCVYAMSLASVATFQYIAHKLGVTGFQASCADMDILTRTRSIKGPWMLIKAEDMLYPQYDLPAKLQEAMDGWQEWVSEEAQKKLSASGNKQAAPTVLAHWKMLVGT